MLIVRDFLSLTVINLSRYQGARIQLYCARDSVAVFSSDQARKSESGGSLYQLRPIHATDRRLDDLTSVLGDCVC